MKKYYHYIFGLVTILIIFISGVFIDYRVTNMRYVTSQYSKYCYQRGNENKNIKHKVYYKSLEECGKTLKM